MGRLRRGGRQRHDPGPHRPVDRPPTPSQSHVAGGAGADVITVGNGKDTVTGDGSLAVGGNVSPHGRPRPRQGQARRIARRCARRGDAATTRRGEPVRRRTLTASASTRSRPASARCACPATVASTPSAPRTTAPLADSAGIKAGTTGGSADEEALYRAHDLRARGRRRRRHPEERVGDDKVFTGSYASSTSSATGGDGAVDDADDRPQHRRHRHRLRHGLRLQRARLRHHRIDPDAEGDRLRRRRSRRAHRRAGLRRDLRRPGQRLRRGRAGDGRRARLGDGRARQRPRRRRAPGRRQQPEAARRRHRQRPHLRR